MISKMSSASKSGTDRCKHPPPERYPNCNQPGSWYAHRLPLWWCFHPVPHIPPVYHPTSAQSPTRSLGGPRRSPHVGHPSSSLDVPQLSTRIPAESQPLAWRAPRIHWVGDCPTRRLDCQQNLHPGYRRVGGIVEIRSHGCLCPKKRPNQRRSVTHRIVKNPGRAHSFQRYKPKPAVYPPLLERHV